MPSAVMSVTPALLPNPTSQSTLSGVKLARSPELDSGTSASINPESPDSMEEGVMATGSQNEDSMKRNLIDKIDGVDTKVPSYAMSHEDQQCSPVRSPAKSESARSPSFTSAGISTSPVLGARDDHRGSRGFIYTRPVARDCNEVPSISNNQENNLYPHSDDGIDNDDRNSNIAGRNLNLITCQDCGLICAGQSHYQVHIRSHTGERPFKCTICGVAFTQKGNLRRHYKIHSDEKPFQCPICSYRCRRRDALNGHMRIHSDVRPYRCVYCARSYKSRQSLKEHEFQCPYKKDPVLPASDKSPGSVTNSDTHHNVGMPEPSGHSPGYRNEDVHSDHTSEEIPPGGSANSSLMPLDPSKYNYLRSVAGNFKPTSTMASLFAQALSANSIPASGKRKSSNPQKIPRFKDFQSNHALMQLQPPLLHQNPFAMRENDRTVSTSSPLPIPAIPLPFIPTNVLSSALQQHHLRAAALNASFQAKSQLQALDFSTNRQREKLQNDEKYYTNAKLSGSAKRKRPKFLNERFVDVEYAEDSAKRSRESSPEAGKSDEYPAEKSSFNDDARARGASPRDNQTGRQTQSHIRSKDHESQEILRVFRVDTNGKGSSNGIPPNAEEIKSYHCRHCRCLFMDEVMYAIHAGCHGFQDPFECNICGFRACDRFQFQSHMTRCEHSETKVGIPGPDAQRWRFSARASNDESGEGYLRQASKLDVLSKRPIDLKSPKQEHRPNHYKNIDQYDNGSEC